MSKYPGSTEREKLTKKKAFTQFLVQFHSSVKVYSNNIPDKKDGSQAEKTLAKASDSLPWARPPKEGYANASPVETSGQKPSISSIADKL